MKIAIITNSLKENAECIAKNAAEILRNSGVEIFAPSDDEGLIDNACFLPRDELFKKADIIIAVGGDGTIIHTAKKAAMNNKPVLGLNAGRVGFLAGLEPEGILNLSNLVGGNYRTEKRMLLSVKVGDKNFYALNDAVVSNGKISRMIDVSAKVGEQTLFYRADGLISATPTGSTAYSLSAGGPVVDPALDSIMLTPICSQSLFARPILLNSDDEIVIRATAPYDEGVYLTIDGEETYPLSEESTVSVTKAKDFTVRLIKLNDGTFLSTLSDKFNLLR